MATRREDQWMEMRYAGTYYLANVCANVMIRPDAYLRHLEDCFGDLRTGWYARPYKKWSNLHEYIDFALMLLLMEDRDDDFDPDRGEQPCGWLRTILYRHGVTFRTHADWLVTAEHQSTEFYFEYLMEEHFHAIREQVVEEVFFLLFLNRSFLKSFNDFLSGYIQDLTNLDTGYKGTRGALKRVRTPEWVRKAVFHRDRGRCVLCQSDVTGLVCTFADDQFDHIVPLHLGGTNDVANLQLLCGPCNQRKGGRSNATGTMYERWY